MPGSRGSSRRVEGLSQGDRFAPGHASSRWAEFVARFHSERPGITERILDRCRSDGIDPYRWCAEPLAIGRGPVLDVACGSSPMAARFTGWIGVDGSAAELRVARSQDRGPLLRASATALPVATNAVEAVVCSMAMQVIEPVPVALSEVGRVLRPGGRTVVLLPANGPLTWRQAAVYLRLQAALGRRIRYPNDRALGADRLAATAERDGLIVVSDERRTFSLRIHSSRDADELVDSLYLPGVGERRRRRGQRVLARSVGTDVAVPLRRVVLDRTA